MKIEKKDLDNQQVEITVELTQEEIAPHLEKAANRLSNSVKISGFRPGKAPYDMVKTAVGEMRIYQEAVQDILQDSFFKAVQQEKLTTVGQPDINVTKMAPGNDFVYTAKVALMPEVTLGDWQNQKVEPTEVVVADEDVEKVINDFAGMQAKETVADREAQKGDKVEVDFEVYVDKVLLEGGSGKKYPLVLGSGSMIPGFEDQVVGMKAGEEKKFKLNFPDKYFQAHLSGKEAEFTVKLQQVFDRELPEINDEWAKKFGSQNLEDFKKQIKDNLAQERQQKADEEWERKAVDAIISKSTFSAFPENLLKNEVDKMKHELRHGVEQRGMQWDNYLNNIKKSESELEKEFQPQAENRIKAALVLRKLAEDNNIKVEADEVDGEIKNQEEMYAGNPQALQNLHSPGYRQYLENILINRKVIAIIKKELAA